MAEETTVAAETAAPSDASSPVEIRDVPNAEGMIPASEVAGLKSAFEKLKEELKALKPKASIVDQLTSDGLDPAELPARLAALKEQQKAEEQLAQLRVEIESKSRAEREQIEQSYQAQVKALSGYLQNQTRDNALTDLFLAGGGQVQSKMEAQQFKKLIGDLVEWEDAPVRDDKGAVIAYESRIKKFKNIDGQTLFVDDSKTGQVREATMTDFLGLIKQGRYGSALQYMLPAYNQSSGAGISGTGGTSASGRIVLKRSQLANMGTLTPAQLKAVQAGEYDLVD